MTSDKAAANFSDRSLLKNLGHWLGMVTLAKNKPILHTVSAHSIRQLGARSGEVGTEVPCLLGLAPGNALSRFVSCQLHSACIVLNSQDLDVKSLLLEAYMKGQQEMLYVVPFVAKVLESSVRSVVCVHLYDITLITLAFCWILMAYLFCAGFSTSKSMDNGYYECFGRASPRA